MTALSAKRNTSMPGQTSDGKRVFSGVALNTNQKVGGHNSSTGQKIKNFFRINSLNKTDGADKAGSDDGQYDKPSEGTRTPQSQHNKSSLRNSRFLPHIGRARSTTVASEGNPLDEGMSPTAHANPYFQHQGPPALRHHDDSSIPSSPTGTSQTNKKIDGASGASDATTGKEELARKLRRVASAPNVQGLFGKSKSGSGGSRPQTAELEDPLKFSASGIGMHGSNGSALSMVETVPPEDQLLPVPGINGAITPGKLRNSIAFRRTYSSNSIKVRNVEVGPGSFDKIKLIGKGDVGKVYLVREKKSARLYAMKGESGVVKASRADGLTDAL
nr:serine/threonine-protein kinase nrc-2 [Quercus suber]